MATNEAATERGKQSLDSTDARAKENSNAPLRLQQDAQSTESKSKPTSLPSAVDKIIRKLWGDSSVDDMPAQPETISSYEDTTKRKENRSKGLNATTMEGLSKREESLLGNRTPPEIGKNQADHPPSQKLPQEKQIKHAERGRTGGSGRSR
ncbi:MAG TPA: hypothetical protein VGC66_12090 [Pyrinomonadaceae bacterium]|jgi:hypothetical protein